MAYKNPITQKLFRLHNSMMHRAYDEKLHARYPSYASCEVCAAWHDFGMFSEWVLDQGNITGLQLDKDVIEPGNKLYAPELCVFVSPAVNKVLLVPKHIGKYPLGVSYYAPSDKYQAGLSVHGKRKHLGLYATPAKASHAYREAKREYIRQFASEQTDIRVHDGLLRHCALI